MALCAGSWGMHDAAILAIIALAQRHDSRPYAMLTVARRTLFTIVTSTGAL